MTISGHNKPNKSLLVWASNFEVEVLDRNFRCKTLWNANETNVIGSIIGIHAVRERYHMLNFYSPEKNFTAFYREDLNRAMSLIRPFAMNFFVGNTKCRCYSEEKRSKNINFSKLNFSILNKTQLDSTSHFVRDTFLKWNC